eukprot:jgi/Chrzof1/7227/Cz02g15140.t1
MKTTRHPCGRVAGLATQPPRHASTVRHWDHTTTCSAVSPMIAAFDTARHSLEEEMVLEGTLHVTSVQAVSCMERFGALDDIQAPPVEADVDNVEQALIQSSSDRVVSEAICLATPMESSAADDEARTRSQVHRSTIGRLMFPRTAAISQEELIMDDVYEQRLAVWQWSSQYTADYLDAAANIRRRRRRAVLRALRVSRDAAKAIVQLPSAVLNQLQGERAA